MIDTLPWPQIFDEAIALFTGLLQIDTVNPPGNEMAAIDYLAAILRKEGIPVQTFEPTPGRGNLVARIKSQAKAPKRPLLLSGHVDVVPFDAAQWKYPPLSGTIAEGFIWGRGAVDMKNMVAMSAAVMLLAKRHAWPLDRDLIFAAVADEEAGCEWGSKWLVEHEPEAIAAEYMLSEIGGFTLHVNGQKFYPIQVAEKGVAWLRLTVKGTPGHGSLPNPDNAIAKAGRIAAKLQAATLPFHPTKTVRAFIELMASKQPFPRSAVLRQVLHPALNPLIIKHVIPAPDLKKNLYALTHNTVNPTIIKGGNKVNVVPPEVTMEVDCRTIPGQSVDDLLKEIRKVISADARIEVLHAEEGHEGSTDDPLFGLMEQVLKAHDPEGIPMPSMIPGFTDAKQYARLGMKCYGFSPVKLPESEQFSALFHGHNERIPVEGFTFGVKALADLVFRVCCET